MADKNYEAAVSAIADAVTVNGLSGRDVVDVLLECATHEMTSQCATPEQLRAAVFVCAARLVALGMEAVADFDMRKQALANAELEAKGGRYDA